MPNCRVAALFLFLFFRFSLVTAASECGSDGRVVLPIGLFASRDVLRTSSAIPAAQLAIQQINEDSTIIPRFCLKEVVFDTNVRQTITYNSSGLKCSAKAILSSLNLYPY